MLPTPGKMLPLTSGSDAAAVMWLDISNDNPKFTSLYASHRGMVLKAVSGFENAGSSGEAGAS